MKKILSFVLIGLISFATFAQCPQAASCTPGIATNAGLGYNGGIYKVILGTINNTTSGDVDGYQDYSCTVGTSLTEGSSYTLTINTGTIIDEHVYVWIDYNDNGVFASSELVYSTSASGSSHVTTINIPSGASLFAPLRMRISTDWVGSTIPTPCSTPEYGQVEDYKVTIIPNNSPPISDFSVDKPLNCDGIVQFTDNSSNSPTSWYWEFGDGNTDTTQNPSHVYSSPGLYTVKLKTSNFYGSDSLTKSNFVQYNDTVPVSISCFPNTASYCCSYGITNFMLNTINNSSSDGIAGYEDFTCGNVTELVEGVDYPFSLQTGTNNQDTKIWIDLDNNGVFNNTTELFFTSLNTLNVSGTIKIPSGIVYDTPIRLRVISDYTGSIFTSCTSVQRGQAEDYTIIVKQNILPPVAVISSDGFAKCSSTFTFSDLSQNAVSTRKWYFGDGDSSTVQNPSHTYSGQGLYKVSLVVTNSYGADTAHKVVAVTGSPKLACSVSTTSTMTQNGIKTVIFESINNTTGNAQEGYKDFTCTQIAVVEPGVTYPISIETYTSSWGGINEELRVWIDYNNDGTFSSSENVFYSPTNNLHIGNITIPLSATRETNLRMRIGTEVVVGPGGGSTPQPCGTVSRGQYEDYGILVIKQDEKPETKFSSPDQNICSNEIRFFFETLNLADYWIWDFGDGITSTSRNPVHTYTNPGIYDVSLVSCNNYGCDTLTKVAYITITDTSSVIPICKPMTLNHCCNGGITQVQFESINSTSNNGSIGFEDLFCTETTVLEGGNYPFYARTSTSTSEKLNVWIDYNNDGSFQAAEEVANSSAFYNHNLTIQIPTGVAVLNEKLRMRVASDIDQYFNGCSDVNKGQVEDYGIVIQPNLLVPDAGFSYAPNGSGCVLDYTFTDSSSFFPTSWLWDFGDGQTSILPNPTHTYSSTGTYTVSLIVCNANGCDTAIVNNAISISTFGVANACTPSTNSNCCGIGTINFQLNNINNNSNDGSVGYEDFTCSIIDTIQTNKKYPITITNGQGGYNEDVKVWIDLDNDGSLNNVNEMIFSSLNKKIHQDSIEILSSSTIAYNTPLRLRVVDEFASIPINNSCENRSYGQVEDYAIVIIDVQGFLNPKNNLVKVFYNNTSKLINYLTLTEIQNIEIRNTLGQMVDDIQGLNRKEGQIQTQKLTKGIYFIRLTGTNLDETHKIIIY